MESFLFGFAYFGGCFALAALSAWVGYLRRARLPGFNRWCWRAIALAGLGAAAMYGAHALALAMRGALKG